MDNNTNRNSRNVSNSRGSSGNRNRGRPFRRGMGSMDFARKDREAAPEQKAISKAEDLPISKEGVYFLPLGGTGEFGLKL